MLYVIMCGGDYPQWEIPRQLTKVGSETLVERTIRLLKENGVKDIAISSNNEIFEKFGVPVLHHDNNFIGYSGSRNWVDAFYLTTEPVCYLLGDVVFSPNAIKTIVETETNDIEFFASSPPFATDYIKKWAEPFAFKVQNTDHFSESIQLCKYYDEEHKFKRVPIAWELWQVIKGTPLNRIDYTNYHVINDYTCDVDSPSDIELFKSKGVF